MSGSRQPSSCAHTQRREHSRVPSSSLPCTARRPTLDALAEAPAFPLDSHPNRRPLSSRATAWAHWLADGLVRAKVSPNSVSLASLVFAALGAALLLRGAQPWCLVAAAACVQLRLCCNLLDGMVAIEGRRQTPTGVLYNELPDRVADSMLIVALGFAVAASWLGWLGALAAALTAYIRVLGGSLGFPQDFAVRWPSPSAWRCSPARS